MKKTRILTVCLLSALGWTLLAVGQWQTAIAVFSVATVMSYSTARGPSVIVAGMNVMGWEKKAKDAVTSRL